MKKMVRLTLLSFALVLCVFCSGCEEQSHMTTSTLRLALTSPHYKTERSLTPDQDLMGITSYHITGTGPKNQTFNLNSDQQLVSIGNLTIGAWDIVAEGLNSKNEVMVRGTLKTLLSKVTSSATLQLDTLVGKGNLSATITWDTDQVHTDVSLEANLNDQGGNVIPLTVGHLDTDAGSVVLSKELDSGSYLLSLKLYSQSVLVSGATIAVRIINGEVSADTIEMVIGDLSTEFHISLVNDTMLPIEGSVTLEPSVPQSGEQVTLTYTPTNLPDDIDLEDLNISWYCEGLLVQSDSTSYTSIPEAGTHRYDVIVNHEKLGSMGSSTLLLTMPL